LDCSALLSALMTVQWHRYGDHFVKMYVGAWVCISSIKQKTLIGMT